MSFINTIKERAKKDKKTIVLPEYMDNRVLEAAKKADDEGIANIIIIGHKEDIDKSGVKIDYDKIELIDPETCEYTEELINKLYELRKEKGMTLEEAKRLLLEDYMYFACMLVKTGRADGVVSGACHSSANTLRPALQIIKTKKDVKLVSAFFAVTLS